jgi:phosphate-selective porin OprO/OprP
LWSGAGALFLAAFGHALPPLPVAAAETPVVPMTSASNSVAHPAEGPAWLKQQVRVRVETNALPSGTDTNGTTPKTRTFVWTASWEGWNGLNLQLTTRTLLGYFVPGVATSEEQTPSEPAGDSNTQTNNSRLHLEKAQMTAKIGGKVAVDAAGYVTANGYPAIDNGIELRRIRAYAKGDCLLVMPVSYEVEVGYTPNQFYIENSYIAFRDIPWIGELKLGQYQAPMGLDLITSGRDITFMEPAAPIQALAPGINAGIQVGQPLLEQRATWKLGLFTAGGGGQDFGEVAKDYGRTIFRVTGLPLFATRPDQADSATLLHLGLSANILYSSSSELEYRSRPESHLAPYAVDTGKMTARQALVTGGEVAWVNGPFSVQGEFLRSWVNEQDGQAPRFDGLYATASWFLTGECRPYDLKEGCFSRVFPRHNFDWGKSGWGAWEVGARFSLLNLNSGDVHGGKLSELMLGLNWYLHAHLKWRFNYGFAHVTDMQPEGNINILQTRVEVDF